MRQLYPFPTGTVDDSLAVNGTLPDQGVTLIRQADIDAAVAIGAKYWRIDLLWDQIERSPGVYDFSAYDPVLRQLWASGFRIIPILDYGNGLYVSNINGIWCGPNTFAQLSAFQAYALAAMRHFRSIGVLGSLWEVWNEPNSGSFWYECGGTGDSAIDYATLFQWVKVGIQASPDLTDEYLLAGSVAHFDVGPNVDWLDRSLGHSLAFYADDAISVHSYRTSDDFRPEASFPGYDRLRSQLTTHANSDRIVSTEWGYCSQVFGDGPQRAGYVTRAWLADLAKGVPLTAVYRLRDNQYRPTCEYTYGLLTPDGTPTFAYRGLQVAHDVLRGSRFAGMPTLTSIPLLDPAFYAYSFTAPDGSTVYAFAIADESRIGQQAHVLLGPGTYSLTTLASWGLATTVTAYAPIGYVGVPLSWYPTFVRRIGP